jgi:hypothetical protein
MTAHVSFKNGWAQDHRNNGLPRKVLNLSAADRGRAVVRDSAGAQKPNKANRGHALRLGSVANPDSRAGLAVNPVDVAAGEDAAAVAADSTTTTHRR